LLIWFTFSSFFCSYTIFKKKLVEYFKKKNEEAESRDRYLTATYCKLTSVWTKKVERLENSKKRREKESKAREMYEKMFPELRKQREDKVSRHSLFFFNLMGQVALCYPLAASVSQFLPELVEPEPKFFTKWSRSRAQNVFGVYC
jgi:hypothetical protein